MASHWPSFLQECAHDYLAVCANLAATSWQGSSLPATQALAQPLTTCAASMRCLGHVSRWCQMLPDAAPLQRGQALHHAVYAAPPSYYHGCVHAL